MKCVMKIKFDFIQWTGENTEEVKKAFQPNAVTSIVKDNLLIIIDTERYEIPLNHVVIFGDGGWCGVTIFSPEEFRSNFNVI